MSNSVRLEVLAVEVNGETRYGILEIRPHPTELICIVHYGPLSQVGKSNDWGVNPDDALTLRCMAKAILVDLVNHTYRR